MNRVPVVDQWVIYFNPSDFPNKYVVRRWSIYADSTYEADRGAFVTDDIHMARGYVPDGMFCIGRFDGDDHAIVEVWI